MKRIGGFLIIVVLVVLGMTSLAQTATVAELQEQILKQRHQIETLSEQVALLSKLVDALNQQPSMSVGINQDDLVTIINDLAALKAENEALRNLLENNRNQLASLDIEDIGVFDKNQLATLNQKVDAVSSKVAEMESVKGSSVPGVDKGDIIISAYYQGQFTGELGDNQQSTFESKLARVALAGRVNPYAKILVQAEFAESPKLLDGILVLSPNQHWSMTFGQYYSPFGTEFLTPPSARPFVTTALAMGLGADRDIGVALSHKNNLSPDVSFDLTAGVYNGSGINRSDVNNEKNIISRLEIELYDMFSLAGNAIIGKTNDTGTLLRDMTTIGGSAMWQWKSETLAGEFIRRDIDGVISNGWYVYGGHMFQTGSKFLPEIQLLARYDFIDNNLDVFGDQFTRLTFGTNLFVDGKYTKIQLNYQINTEELIEVDNNEFLAKVQVAF